MFTDRRIDEISTRVLVSELGIQGRNISICKHYLQLSIAHGVRSMLENFKHLMIAKVKKLSREILNHLSDEDSHLQQTENDVQFSFGTDNGAIMYTECVKRTMRNE